MTSSTLIYAHRGGAGLYPESTLFAYKQVIMMGVDVIDMDICMSKDHELIVSHTPYLDSELTKDASGKYLVSNNILIKDLTIDELKKYNVGQIKPGSLREKEQPYQTPLKEAYIPTLREVIHLAKELSNSTMRYQIEIKYDRSEHDTFVSVKYLIKALLKFLKEEDILHLTEVQCFDWDVLIQLQLQEPSIATAFLSPSYSYHFNLSLPQTIKHLGGTIWGPDYHTLSTESLLEAKYLGLKVVPWTINEIDTMKELIKEGIDGIITDRPDLLKTLLKSN